MSRQIPNIYSMKLRNGIISHKLHGAGLSSRQGVGEQKFPIQRNVDQSITYLQAERVNLVQFDRPLCNGLSVLILSADGVSQMHLGPEDAGIHEVRIVSALIDVKTNTGRFPFLPTGRFEFQLQFEISRVLHFRAKVGRVEGRFGNGKRIVLITRITAKNSPEIRPGFAEVIGQDRLALNRPDAFAFRPLSFLGRLIKFQFFQLNLSLSDPCQLL